MVTTKFNPIQRYRIFFSAEKLDAHSHSISDELVFFFPKAVFFFPDRFFPIFSQFLDFFPKFVEIPKSTQNFEAGKKNTVRKKKYTIFTHSLDFVKNVTKMNFSKKKKNTVPLGVHLETTF